MDHASGGDQLVRRVPVEIQAGRGRWNPPGSFRTLVAATLPRDQTCADALSDAGLQDEGPLE